MKALSRVAFNSNIPENYKEIIDRYQLLEGQHPMRAWEYAVGFEAIEAWRDEKDLRAGTAGYDVGGGGSRYREALSEFGVSSISIDPMEPNSIRNYSEDAETMASLGFRSKVVTCISVIEHVENQVAFIDALAKLLVKDGLLVLTMDYHPTALKDDKHFHWMRQRIYNRFSHAEVMACFGARGFRALGTVDMAAPEDKEMPVYDYTFASLVMTKEID